MYATMNGHFYARGNAIMMSTVPWHRSEALRIRKLHKLYKAFSRSFPFTIYGCLFCLGGGGEGVKFPSETQNPITL